LGDGERAVERGDDCRGLLAGDRLAANRPPGAAFNEILEAGVAPRALVMAPRGVEHAALALRPHPGPRLLRRALLTVFQHRAVLLIVFGVDVGLVPALEPLEPLHQRVVGLGYCGAKGARAVFEELRPDEVDVLLRVEEAVAGAVQRNEPLAAL